MSSKYESPYTYDQMIAHGYSKTKADELLKDPVHGWRMQTGIELIHREPSKTELKRIWANWNLMTDDMKLKSDRKEMELFGCTNEIMYRFLLPQYRVENPGKDMVRYPNPTEIKAMAKQLHIDLNNPKLRASVEALNSSQITFKPVNTNNQQDIALVANAVNLAAKASGDESWTKAEVIKKLEDMKKYQQEFLFIIANNKKVGYVRLGSYQDKILNTMCVSINTYAIFAEYQGKGYGSQSLQAIAKYCTQKYPKNPITIGVAKQNERAYRLYIKCGFVVLKEYKNAYFLVLKKSIATEALIPQIIKNIKNNLVYHGSPKRLTTISGGASNTPDAEKSVFVSPFKYFAAMFMFDFQGIVDTIEKQIGKQHIQIDNFGFMEWNYTPRSTTELPKEVNILVRTPEKFKSFSGVNIGYMHTVDFNQYKDKADMWSHADKSDVEFIIHGDVKPIKCEQVTLKYTVMPDEKKYHSSEAVITPVVTTVVLSPTEVYTIRRGDVVETQNGCRIMVDNEGNPHALEGSDEKLMPFLHASTFGTITNRAKSYYNPVGSNSWQHIQQVLTQAIKFVRFVDHREINPIEYAAVLFHDSSVKSDSAKIHHALKGAEIAKKVLKDLFTEKELDEIYVAIKAHDKEDNPEWTFTNSTADLLASADANPPDPDWILNKSWSWGISHGLSPEERITNMMGHSVPFYGSTPEEGGMRWPKHYAKYYKDDITNLRKIFKSLTPETCLERIMAYRKRHRLSENDIRLPEPSCEVLTQSTEALPAGFKEKRKKIEAYILSSMKLLDRHTDINQKYWKDKFASMSDADFDKFMHFLKDKKTNIHMFVPPLKVTLKNAELVDAAHKLGVKLMHRIWMTDPNTGMKYLTPEEYMVVQLPVRRQQQYLDEKISVPDNDKTIDGLTGQVTGDSAAYAISNPEIQIMQARNLDASLFEYVNVRGGNINSYAEFKRALEETGSVSLNSLDPNNRTRVAVMGGVLLTSMMIENNLAEV